MNPPRFLFLLLAVFGFDMQEGHPFGDLSAIDPGEHFPYGAVENIAG
jgi:hypothetical protein